MDLLDLSRPDPNFTILVPGGCNAKCDFCFWNADFGRIRPPADYLSELRLALLALPPSFTTISVSGGEPTVSKFLVPILRVIDKVRMERPYNRVVLTSNGSNSKALESIAVEGFIDHLNISRHEIDDSKNEAIFKTKVVPTTAMLKDLIWRIHVTSSVDVCMNAVVPPDLPAHSPTRLSAINLIEYARDTGFDAISLRKEASNVIPTPAENEFRRMHGVVHETKCPVCRGMSQRVNGFDVRWKGSVAEPSIVSGKTYEAIFHPDGRIYADWGMKIPLALHGRLKATPKAEEKVRVVYVDRDNGRSGCGSSGCGSSRC